MPKFSPVVPRRRRISSSLAVLALAVLTAAGCDSSTGNDDSISNLAVNPPTPVMHIGGTQQLVATPTTSSGKIIEGRTTAWASSNTAVASVDGNGLVTAVAPGTATVSATVGSLSDDAVITVWHPVQSLSLDSEDGSVTMCQEGSLDLVATITDAAGTVVDDRQIAWTTDDPSVASVSPFGQLTGGPQEASFGTTTITAVSEGVSGTFTITTNCLAVVDEVTITPTLGAFLSVGLTDQFVGEATAASGTVLNQTGRVVSWTSTDPAVATVSATGLVTAVSLGEADIIFSVDGVADTLTAEVYPQLLEGVATNTGPIAEGADLWWVVDVPAGTTNITVTLAGGAEPDTDLVLYDPAGDQADVSAGASSNEEVSETAQTGSTLTTGRWLVRWNGFEAHTGATLTATITP